MKRKKLKLHVWESVLTSWEDGIMFALAENEEEARELISKKMGHRHEDLAESPRVITEKEGFYIYGGS